MRTKPLWKIVQLVIAFFLLGNVGCRSDLSILKPSPSPYLPLFQANGFLLPEDTHIERVFSIILEGQTYEVLEYQSASGAGIQIKHNEAFLKDPDIAFDVLLSYAWSPKNHEVSSEDLESLRQLHSKLNSTEQEYKPFFEFADSLKPVLEKVDELKDNQITGIPVIKIGAVPIIDVTNYWDLICTIPLDVFDLCLLEPAMREIHEQGVEIEQLIKDSSTDLAEIISLLEAQSQGEVQNGLQLKEEFEKAINRLNNLVWKLDQFETNVSEFQAVNRAIIEALENQRWGNKVGSVILFLQQNVPGFDLTNPVMSLAGKLRDLDLKMSDYLKNSNEIEADISSRLALLTDVRVRTDEALKQLSSQWRFHPAD